MKATIRKKTCTCGKVVVVRSEVSDNHLSQAHYTSVKGDVYTGYFRNRRRWLANWVYCASCNRKHEIAKMMVAWTLEEPGKELTF